MVNKLYPTTRVQTIKRIEKKLTEDLRCRTELTSDNSNSIFTQRLEKDFNQALANLNLLEETFEFSHLRSILVEMGFLKECKEDNEFDRHPKHTLMKEERGLLLLLEKEFMLKDVLTRLEVYQLILCFCHCYEFYLANTHQKRINEVKAEKSPKKNDYGERTIISTVLREAFDKKEEEISSKGKYCSLTHDQELIIDRTQAAAVAKDFGLFYVNYRERCQRVRPVFIQKEEITKTKNDIDIKEYYRNYLKKLALRYKLNPVDFEGVDDVYELKMIVEDLKAKSVCKKKQ